MEEFLSQRELTNLYNRERRSLGKEGIHKKIGYLRSESYTSTSNRGQRSIFLSHSHRDVTIVAKIGLLFERLSTELYIDWLDTALPEETNRSTALKIKARIKTNHKFLFLATYRGVQSKWCSWEIGVADNLKEEKDIAVLPIESRNGNWNGSEYLDLYPIMKVSRNNLELIRPEDITILYPSGIEESLIKWISK